MLHAELVRSSVIRGVARIVLDSPHNRNALSLSLCRELNGHLKTALDDSTVRIIVLAHTGPVFSSGADLKETRRSSEVSRKASTEFAALLELIWTSPKPVIAQLTGQARAGGVGLVAVCDLAVAVESVTFAFTEIRIGVVPAVISVVLRRKMDPRFLRRFFLTGETFNASTAVASGLLTAAVRADEIEGEVQRFIEMVVLGGPRALAATKEVLRGDFPSLAAELSKMQELSRNHFDSAEGREGMLAFADRRPPAWLTSESQ